MDEKQQLLLLDELLELDPGTLTANDALESLESWDSLAVLSFIALADEKFSVVLSAEKISEAKTVSDLLSLLSQE